MTGRVAYMLCLGIAGLNFELLLKATSVAAAGTCLSPGRPLVTGMFRVSNKTKADILCSYAQTKATSQDLCKWMDAAFKLTRSRQLRCRLYEVNLGLN
jgi:hypothetical protein